MLWGGLRHFKTPDVPPSPILRAPGLLARCPKGIHKAAFGQWQDQLRWTRRALFEMPPEAGAGIQ